MEVMQVQQALAQLHKSIDAVEDSFSDVTMDELEREQVWAMIRLIRADAKILDMETRKMNQGM